MHSFKNGIVFVAVALSTMSAAVPITHVRLLPLKPPVVQPRAVTIPTLDTPAIHAPTIGSRNTTPPVLNAPSLPNTPSIPAIGQPDILPAVNAPAPDLTTPAIPVPSIGTQSLPSIPAVNAPATQVPATLPEFIANVKNQVTGIKSQLDAVAGGDVAAVVKIVASLKTVLVQAVADVGGLDGVNFGAVVDLGKLVAELLTLIANVLALVLKIAGSVNTGDVTSLIHDIGTVVSQLLSGLLAKVGDLHANLVPIAGDVVPTLESLGWSDVLKALNA